MRNNFSKMVALVIFIFLGGMVYGQAAKSASVNITPVIPQFTSVEEKTQWIAEHPAEYAEAINDATTPAAVTVNAPATVNYPAHAPLPEGFPVFINTGNLDADNADYCGRKAAWIAAHPEEYAQMKNPK